ncbi:MAG: hypothetical protein DRJ03_15750 [Chloroflexi bacterium]|nr:MAG: hypothetical protein DRI81_07500 [Chloroflexota bacterium]RLC83913.1 MAG: hypothetical protein DRJ03_15750 [Chloroflexota bacterium]
MNKQKLRILARTLALELAGYGLLVAAYAAFVAPRLEKPLAQLFNNDNLIVYAFAGLGLIVVQGLILDAVTSFLVSQLHLDRLSPADKEN